MTQQEDELHDAMQKAQDAYNRARRELAEFAAQYDREMLLRAERVQKLHHTYKTAWYAWTEEKQRTFIAELEAVVNNEKPAPAETVAD